MCWSWSACGFSDIPKCCKLTVKSFSDLESTVVDVFTPQQLQMLANGIQIGAFLIPRNFLVPRNACISKPFDTGSEWKGDSGFLYQGPPSWQDLNIFNALHLPCASIFKVFSPLWLPTLILITLWKEGVIIFILWWGNQGSKMKGYQPGLSSAITAHPNPTEASAAASFPHYWSFWL